MLNKIEIIEAQKGSASIPPQESHGAYY
jgi:hypothetical protein